MIQTIKSIVEAIQWKALFERRHIRWFFIMHMPWIIRCLFQTPIKPGYKNLYFNTRIYDGCTRNDFIKGNLVQFLYQLGTIKQPKSYHSDHNDGRGYFIGYQDDQD